MINTPNLIKESKITAPKFDVKKKIKIMKVIDK